MDLQLMCMCVPPYLVMLHAKPTSSALVPFLSPFSPRPLPLLPDIIAIRIAVVATMRINRQKCGAKSYVDRKLQEKLCREGSLLGIRGACAGRGAAADALARIFIE